MKISHILNEFASTGGGHGGNYLKALASAWYNDTFNTGDLHKGIKSQEDVERILERGIHCGDGKVRKYSIGYNANFDGVEIQSDDHYEYSDTDDAGRDIDSRTGKPWGPYDVVEFGGNELDESLSESSKCTCHPGDSDPDCAVHGLEPMDMGDALDVREGVAEGSETAADIDKKIEFHKQGQAAAQYKGSMNKMHAAKIRELEAKKQALQQGVAEGEVTKTSTGIIHKATDKYGAGEEPFNPRNPGKYVRDLDHVNKQQVKDLDASMGITWKNRGTNGVEVDEGDKKPQQSEQPEADYGDDYQAMVSRVKKLAGLGPLKTVYDPQKRVYRNMPTAVQPKK